MSPKRTMSFEERRDALREHMADNAAAGTLSREIEFADGEVAEFLRRLDKSERESLKSRLTFK